MQPLQRLPSDTVNRQESRALTLHEIDDQKAKEICCDIGSEEVAFVLGDSVGPRSNLW